MNLQQILKISLTGRCRSGRETKGNLNMKEVKNEKCN
jgi:hypothetical protein